MAENFVMHLSVTPTAMTYKNCHNFVVEDGDWQNVLVVKVKVQMLAGACCVPLHGNSCPVRSCATLQMKSAGCFCKAGNHLALYMRSYRLRQKSFSVTPTTTRTFDQRVICRASPKYTLTHTPTRMVFSLSKSARL